jgi:hypothetical protein
LAHVATIYSDEYDRFHQPPADCYCPQCQRPYSMADVGDGASSLCDLDHFPIQCL